MASNSTENQRKKRKQMMRRILIGLAAFFLLVVFLLVATGLLAERFLNNPELKEKIQQKAYEVSGVILDYRQIHISYLPLPAIELHDLAITVKGRGHGTAAVLRLYPDLGGMMGGNIPVGRLELERPDISLALPEPESMAGKEEEREATTRKDNARRILAGLTIAGSELVVDDGRLSIASSTGKLEGEGLTLKLHLSLLGNQSGEGMLQSSLSRLTMVTGEDRQLFEDIDLVLSGFHKDGTLSVELQQLRLARPGLELSGSFSHTATTARLDLSGKDIDVDATREAALKLAGKVSPIPEIFTYLVGGTVPHIHFVAEASSVADLGGYANFHLDGKLAKGQVAVPEIGLDLTEVDGGVSLVDGVLTGSNLSARLGKSTGESGRLAIGLAEDSDLFSLAIMLNADLTEGKAFLARVVDKTQFIRELDRITLQEGTFTGKLVLGDSFANLGVKVEDEDVQFSMQHTALPFPIEVVSGRMAFADDQVTLQDISGTFGTSSFAGLSGTVDWHQGMWLDLDFQEAHPVPGELFPWLKKMAALQSTLQPVSSLNGRVNLHDVHFAGMLDEPEGWQYGAAGEVADITAITPYFPAEISIAQGGFTLDGRTMNLHNIRVSALDGLLQLQGRIEDFNGIELQADGTLGADSVTWLTQKFAVADAYAVRPPLKLSKVRLAWRKNESSGFSGEVNFSGGPVLNLQVTQGPEGIRVEQLKVKGFGTDVAEMKYLPGISGIETVFAGTLRHETLEAIFARPQPVKGLLEGEFGLVYPKAGDNVSVVKGHLNGTQLQIPLQGDELGIGGLALEAKDATVRVEIADLFWKGYLVNPLVGTVNTQPDRIAATIDRAELCGIPVVGKGFHSEKTFDIALNVNGKNLDVATSYTCLTKGEVKMSGTMEIYSRVVAAGRLEMLLNSLEGPFEMTFVNGLIRQGAALAAILEVLNVTEVVKGRLPKLAAGGFPYNSIKLKGRFGGGKLHLEEIMMDGETLDLVGNGYIDLEQGTLEVELLAAPFKTVDTVVKYIPGVNYLLGGSLVAIPLSVKGTLERPKVAIMSPSSVSKSLLNLGARTINLPLKLFQSILSIGE